MKPEKIGEFIAKLRRENNLTQEELAEKLSVTDRAISNWETGRRVPDISFYKPLCEIFNISVSELLNGKRNKVGYSSSEDIIIETFEKNNKNKLLLYKTIRILIVIITILSVFLIIRSNDKKLDIRNISLAHPDKPYTLELGFKYKDINIYYYGVENIQVCNKNDTCIPIHKALKRKKITIEDLKDFHDKEAVYQNLDKSILYDGGTSIYQGKGYSIAFCNTVGGNKDIYIGDTDMIEKLNGAYCGHTPNKEKGFTRTYKILESKIYDSDYVLVLLENNKNEKETVLINIRNNLSVGKTYEFTFYAYGYFTDNIKNIFEKATLMYVKETDDINQINENIYFNEEDKKEDLNDLKHVSMEVSNITNTSLSLTIKDMSGGKYIYGESYRIDKLENDNWIELKNICSNCAWNMMAYGPDKSNILKFDLNFERLYGKLDKGTYRIVKDVSTNNEDTLYISASFNIK